MATYIETYRGYKISLNTSHRFEIGAHDERGEDAPNPRIHPSIDEARKHIDEHAGTLDENKLELKVVLGNGMPATLTSISRTDSRLNGTKGEQAYVDVPWIRELVDEKRKLESRLEALRQELIPYSVHAHIDESGGRRYYGSRVETAAHYALLVAGTKKAYEETLKRAQAREVSA